MTRFRYRATDDKGQAVTDTMEARTARQVIARLHERGLTISAVEEIDKPRGLLRVSERLTMQELQAFVRQLHAITRSDLPLAPALKSLAADLPGGRFKAAVERLRQDIEQGLSLDEALEKRHAAFPQVFVDIVRAGQAAGNLSGVLQLYLHHTERVVRFRNTLKIAMTYPAIVLGVTALIVVFLLTTVVPIFGDIFNEFGGMLPMPTKLLVSASRTFNDISVWMAIAIVVFCIGLYLLRRNIAHFESGRIGLDWLRLHTPFYGRLHYLLAVSRFARTLSLMLASRASLLPGLELAGAASGSALLRRAVDEASLRIANGDRLADAFAATGFFSYHFCWLLRLGEERGEAEIALEGAADAMEQELSAKDRLLGNLLSPFLIVIVGVIIGGIVVSLYLPVFSFGF